MNFVLNVAQQPASDPTTLWVEDPNTMKEIDIVPLMCSLSTEAQSYLKQLLDVLQSPAIFPRCKEFDRQFKALSHRGLIVEEWKQCVRRIPPSEQYSFFALTLKHEIYEYDVEFSTYDINEMNQCVDCLTHNRGTSTMNKNLLSLFLNLRGYILFTYLNRSDQAITDFTWAIELDSTAVDNYASRAWCYYRQRKYHEAICDMNRAIAIDPSAENYATRGLVHQGLGKHQEAVHDCTKSLELSPNNIDTLLDRARSLRELQRYEEGCNDYKRAIGIDPSNSSAYTCLGYVLLYNLQDFDMAVHYFTLALQVDNSHSDTYVNRGTAYRLLGNFEAAIADCDKALQVDSRNAIAFNNKGFAYQEQKLFEQALVQYRKALEIDPDLATAWFNISRIYFINRQFVEALHYAKIAYRLKPADGLYADDCSYFVSLLKEGSVFQL